MGRWAVLSPRASPRAAAACRSWSRGSMLCALCWGIWKRAGAPDLTHLYWKACRNADQRDARGEKEEIGAEVFLQCPHSPTAPGALTLQSPQHFTGSGGVPKLPTLNGKLHPHHPAGTCPERSHRRPALGELVRTSASPPSSQSKFHAQPFHSQSQD